MRALPMIEAAPHKGQLYCSVRYAKNYVADKKDFFMRLFSKLGTHTCAPAAHCYTGDPVTISSMYYACPFLTHIKPTYHRLSYRCDLFEDKLSTVIPNNTGIPFHIYDFEMLMNSLQRENQIAVGTAIQLQIGRLWQCRQLQEDLTMHGRYLGESRDGRSSDGNHTSGLNMIPFIIRTDGGQSSDKISLNAKKEVFLKTLLNPSPPVTQIYPMSAALDELHTADEMKTARSRYEEILKELPKVDELSLKTTFTLCFCNVSAVSFLERCEHVVFLHKRRSLGIIRN